ncbi:hypothetical protein G6F66_013705 [Rhizopus arrhizus]|nr:hypothetical protein G6F66_013705 [Rhizopus arrhizus]
MAPTKKVQYINDWSPNSPDLNPIEHVWHLLKLRLSLYERKARNIDELWERVDFEWNKLDKDVCRSYIDSMPDRIAAVVPIFSPSVGLPARNDKGGRPKALTKREQQHLVRAITADGLENAVQAQQSLEQNLGKSVSVDTVQRGGSNGLVSTLTGQ